VEDGWRVERDRDPAGELHRRSVDALRHCSGRVARVLEATGPALVLGSSQRQTDVNVDAAATAGLEVVRRRSGGGAVVVGPGQVVWVDLLIPIGDPLWDDDVGRAAWWVGEAWAAALEAVDFGPQQVWKRAMRTSRWSGRVCFAGVGPGEVLVGGQKVVGVSQRRTRDATLFQTAALIKWDPVGIVDALQLGQSEAASALSDLAGVARGVGAERAGPLGDAFVGALTR
jgi:lipoate-protein ligase A